MSSGDFVIVVVWRFNSRKTKKKKKKSTSEFLDLQFIQLIEIRENTYLLSS